MPLRTAEESMFEIIDAAAPGDEDRPPGAAGDSDDAGHPRDAARHVDGGHPDDRPWLAWSVGDRVVVRYRIQRTRDGGPGHTDALGYLIACSPEGVTVRTRTGDVAVPAEAIAVGKRVPPPPPRRRADS